MVKCHNPKYRYYLATMRLMAEGLRLELQPVPGKHALPYESFGQIQFATVDDNVAVLHSRASRPEYFGTDSLPEALERYISELNNPQLESAARAAALLFKRQHINIDQIRQIGITVPPEVADQVRQWK